MTTKRMTAELLALVAERFKALGEPARLRILNELRHGEATVGDVSDATGMGHANISKHLQLLHAQHFVSRRKDGLYVFYDIADDSVFALCDIMCGRIAENAQERRRIAVGRR